MRIYNATKGTMNIPMANGSRLIIGSMEASRQFFPTVELLNLLVSAYSREDIAIIIDSATEMSMGATVSALPGYIANTLEEAIFRFKKDKPEDKKVESKVEAKPKETPKVATTTPVVNDKQEKKS